MNKYKQLEEVSELLRQVPGNSFFDARKTFDKYIKVVCDLTGAKLIDSGRDSYSPMFWFDLESKHTLRDGSKKRAFIIACSNPEKGWNKNIRFERVVFTDYRQETRKEYIDFDALSDKLIPFLTKKTRWK